MCVYGRRARRRPIKGGKIMKDENKKTDSGMTCFSYEFAREVTAEKELEHMHEWYDAMADLHGNDAVKEMLE